MTVKELIQRLSQQDQNKPVIAYDHEGMTVWIEHVFAHADVVALDELPNPISRCSSQWYTVECSTCHRSVPTEEIMAEAGGAFCQKCWEGRKDGNDKETKTCF